MAVDVVALQHQQKEEDCADSRGSDKITLSRRHCSFSVFVFSYMALLWDASESALTMQSSCTLAKLRS